MRAAARRQGLRCTATPQWSGILVDSEDAWDALPASVRDHFDNLLIDQLTRLILDGIPPDISRSP
jgi:hypothetical protein